MGPALSPGAVGQEMAACAVLGGVLEYTAEHTPGGFLRRLVR